MEKMNLRNFYISFEVNNTNVSCRNTSTVMVKLIDQLMNIVKLMILNKINGVN